MRKKCANPSGSVGRPRHAIHVSRTGTWVTVSQEMRSPSRSGVECQHIEDTCRASVEDIS